MMDRREDRDTATGPPWIPVLLCSLTLIWGTGGCASFEKDTAAPLAVEPPHAERDRHYANELATARARWLVNHAEIDAIWVGRHLGYLGRYKDALAWYTDRLEDFPESARLLRHRGHRLISVRRFSDAIVDLERAWTLAKEGADAVEPDGAPNELGIPRSTTHTNILYHLGLARYLMGEFDEAARVFGDCIERSPNDDMLVAALNWYVHALRRAGREKEATAALERVLPEMDVIENRAYHQLLLLQKGSLDPEDLATSAGDGIQDATAAYGLGNWHYCNGDREEAQRLWRSTIEGTPPAAFGHVAAEVGLARVVMGGP